MLEKNFALCATKKKKYSNPFKLNGRSLTNQVPFLCYDIPALLYVLQDLIMPHYSHFLWCVYDRPNRVILFYHFFGIMCLLTLKNTTCLPSARRVRRYQREVIRIRKQKDKQHNGQKKKNKRTNNDIQSTTQKTKDRSTRTLLKTGSKPSKTVTIPTNYDSYYDYC